MWGWVLRGFRETARVNYSSFSEARPTGSLPPPQEGRSLRPDPHLQFPPQTSRGASPLSRGTMGVAIKFTGPCRQVGKEGCSWEETPGIQDSQPLNYGSLPGASRHQLTQRQTKKPDSPSLPKSPTPMSASPLFLFVFQ